tara:strand:+ start:48 stop:1466 length:1419 start_codon:yes stop_codon:yes gene_type:complete
VSLTTSAAAAQLGEFVSSASIPDEAREAARAAVQDTVGVILAGAVEPAAKIVQRVLQVEGAVATPPSKIGRSHILGSGHSCGPSSAALVNGTAAHALDFDDMCWVTLAHPSTPLVAAGLAVGESVEVSGRTLLDSYVVGFEVEAVLGAVMNPSHYEHGWHCTSTIGTIGAAATAARVLGLDTAGTTRALSIAASEASGLKANFGTMVKPLQGGLAARNGVLAALLAQEGLSASSRAIESTQGFLVAMHSEKTDISSALVALGHHWEILEGGITVKLYPSCAATHPTIDTLLDLRSELGLVPDAIESIDVFVDPVTPTVLIYDRPQTGLQGKFSLHYCAAAAIGFGGVGIETFEPAAMQTPSVANLVSRIDMHADENVGRDAAPLTQARIVVCLRDGRTIERSVDGARGYPNKPATTEELNRKFLHCAERAISAASARKALNYIQNLSTEGVSVGTLVALLVGTETYQEEGAS